MVSNMDTTGTFEIHNAMWNHGIVTCLHKHYSTQELLSHF
jgi:GMP reductase